MFITVEDKDLEVYNVGFDDSVHVIGLYETVMEQRVGIRVETVRNENLNQAATEKQATTRTHSVTISNSMPCLSRDKKLPLPALQQSMVGPQKSREFVTYH